MKKIEHIREDYDIITEKDDSDTRKLTSLVRAGLFDQKKLPMLKRALEKDPSKLTMAERKGLLELLDSLMSQVLHSQSVYSKVKQNVGNEVNEAKDYYGADPRFGGSSAVSERDMPTIIILKRKSIRVYPDNQKVGLYYSQLLDRYIAIPFGTSKKNTPYTAINEGLDEGVDYKAAYKDYKKDHGDDDDTKDKILRDPEKLKKFVTQKASQGKIRPAHYSGRPTWLGGDSEKQELKKAANKDFNKNAFHSLDTMAAAAGAHTGLAVRNIVTAPLRSVKKAVKGTIDLAKKPKPVSPPAATNTPKPNPIKESFKQKINEKRRVYEDAAEDAQAKYPIRTYLRQKLGIDEPTSPEDLAKDAAKAKTVDKVDNAYSMDPGDPKTPLAVKALHAITPLSRLVTKPAGATAAAVKSFLPKGTAKGTVAAGEKETAATVAKGATSTAEKGAVSTTKKAAVDSTKKTAVDSTKKGAKKATVGQILKKGATGATALGVGALAAGAALGRGGGSEGSDAKNLTPAKFGMQVKTNKPEAAGVKTGVDTRTANSYRKSLVPMKEEKKLKSKDDEFVPNRILKPAAPINSKLKINSPKAAGITTGVDARMRKYERDFYNQQNESVMTQIQKMVNEDVTEMQLNIGESTLKINNTIAKKVVGVYESLNKENKKKMEDMLNEGTTDSFMKLINFAVRQ